VSRRSGHAQPFGGLADGKTSHRGEQALRDDALGSAELATLLPGSGQSCCDTLGDPQSVAMSISGHKTVSMFIRYNITSASDRIDALRRTAEHLAAQPKKRQGGAVVDLPGREAASR